MIITNIVYIYTIAKLYMNITNTAFVYSTNTISVYITDTVSMYSTESVYKALKKCNE